MLDMLIAECPYCGQRYHSWSEEDALAKYEKHRCMTTRADKEIIEILDRVLEED